MKSTMKVMFSSVLTATLFVTALPSQAKDTGTTANVPVTMTVTAGVADGKRMPDIKQDDVSVRIGKQRQQVTQWVPAKGEHAGLDLFVLIDDASSSGLGIHLSDIRAFIENQPATAAVGVGYIRNATVQIAQNFTTDHAQAAKAVRLPLGTPGAYGSPYLSIVDLMKRWPESANRREVIMITDGLDRAHRSRNALLNPDVDTAIRVAQRTGTMVHTIYAPGVGRMHRSYLQALNGQNAMAKLSEATGGESFFLGLQNPVSLQPYLKDLQNILDNQYLLTFSAKPSDKAGLQYLDLSTQVAGVEFGAAGAVWVPVTK